MIELLDFKNITVSSTDRHELKSLLRQLMGQPFLFFRISYGDELNMHLGEAIEYDHPKLKNRRKGSYVLSARASLWYFRPNTQPIMFVGADGLNLDSPPFAQKLDIREIESRPLVEAGSVVARVDILPSPEGFGLALVLSDRSTLIIVPTPLSPSIEAGEEEVDDWELFTPHNRFLRVGPGPRWAYLESDKPASA